MSGNTQSKLSRREFMLAATAALAAPSIVPAAALGKGGKPAPSERIVVGCIGMGNMGSGNLRSFLREAGCQVVAVCDVDAQRLERARQTVNEFYGNQDCVAYGDFRELCARGDIDAVSMATPDHWHAIAAITALKSGKDVYGEKPLAHSLREGRAMVDTVHRYARVWQTGSWQRSRAPFRFACELIRNGRVGKVARVEVGLPHGFEDPRTRGVKAEDERPQTPPEWLNYNLWVGPAPWSPYVPGRLHREWRFNLDTGGGTLMDWIGHHLDIGHWGLGNDERIGPLELVATGKFPKTGIWNAPTEYRITAQYPDNIEVVIAAGDSAIRSGTKWIGEDGRWVWVDRSGMAANPKSLLQERFGPGDVRLPVSTSHHGNFLDAVRTRSKAIAPVEAAHLSVTPGHLGMISMLLGRKVRWDSEHEQILDDPTAQAMLGNALRSPWRL